MMTALPVAKLSFIVRADMDCQCAHSRFKNKIVQMTVGLKYPKAFFSLIKEVAQNKVPPAHLQS